MRLLNLRINFFYLLQTFCPHLGSFFVVSSHYVSAKKSNLDRALGPVVQRIEALSLYGSRWALSEDSGFNSYPSQPEVYLVKNVVWQTTTIESRNYWGYGYKTQHSYPRSRLITWRRPEVKFGRNVVRRRNKKTYQDEDKKSAIKKKKKKKKSILRLELICLQRVKWFSVFLFNTNNCLILIICLHRIEWFQVFLGGEGSSWCNS